ncbi:hypothetical protein MNBD_PLANCTO02-732 [hydrothermal vent metagenome]|uniref:Uncharacterized protein n=1 Tax=hydrothermal vent metagenome TaxID=652676 RepID=A0A3B1DVN3_9ZZZZ
MRGWLAKLLGDKGERAAAKFLKKKGFCILARQYKNRVGEIDLIATDKETIVFVEVKTRKSNRAGIPVEAVTLTKQKQIIRTALVYLKRYQLLDHRVRFDVVGIIWEADSSTPEISHYLNAFSSDDFGQMFS